MTDEKKVFAEAMNLLEKKDYVQAEQFFRNLMSHGNIHAQINLATMYLDPNNSLHKYQEAYDLLIDAVEKEDGIGATNNLGMMYMAGLHVERDFNKAFYWFQKGADHEIAACLVNLAKIHITGVINEGEPNYKPAIDCYIRSYKFGYSFGISELGSIISELNTTTKHKDQVQTLIDYIKLSYIAENDIDPKYGDGSAESELAEMFDRIEGVYSFKADAAQWYTAARKKGCTKAINNLGAMYLKGEYVKQDFNKAFQHFKEAAELGNSFAMKNLGCCYIEGNGIPMDLDAAAYWLEKSFTAGCKQAIPALAFSLYSKSPTNPLSYQAYMEKACDQNHPECLFILGKEYLDGDKIKQDINKGISYLQRATSLGHEIAPLILGLYFISTDNSNDYANASKYLLIAVNHKNKHSKSLLVVAQIFFNMRMHKEFKKDQTMNLNKVLADNGDAEAQARVAALYLEEGETLKNVELALKYAKLSADQKCVTGLSVLMTMHIIGDLPDKDVLSKVLDHLEEASKNGSDTATFALGLFYEVGTSNIAMDRQLAIEYISRAASQGFEPASIKIKSMLKN